MPPLKNARFATLSAATCSAANRVLLCLVGAVVLVVAPGCGGLSGSEALAEEGVERSERAADDRRESNGSTSAGIAVVELFTSQGCSSCPPADRVLAEVDAHARENGFPVYVLSFHVDYWNRLGWTDPFSGPAATARQRAYARHFKSQRVYTPQAVINGQAETLGSRGREVVAAIRTALDTATPAAITGSATRRDEATLTVGCRWQGVQAAAEVHVAVVQRSATTDVPRGENAGRRLAHVNVVRALQSFAIGEENERRVEITVPEGLATDDLDVILYVQRTETRQIVAAARIACDEG